MSSIDPDYNPVEEEEEEVDVPKEKVLSPKIKNKKQDDTSKSPSVRQPATYAAVHIENLVKPRTECLIRSIDRAHVENIKREMREKQVTKFTLIVANVPSAEMPPIKDLQKARSCRLEVLGGNHTRQAALELWVETEDKRYALWPCQLYHQLTEEESKALAYLHNRNHEVAKQMTFLDYVRLFRTERVAIQRAGVPPESLDFEWKEKLSHMMSLTKRILSANYLTALRVSSVNDTVWPHMASFFTAWEKGQIKGQKKGPMKAYFLANAYNLEDQQLIKYLKQMMDGQLSPRNFQKMCAEASSKKRHLLKRRRSKECGSSDGESDNNVSIRSVKSTSNDDSDADSDGDTKQKKEKTSIWTKNGFTMKKRKTGDSEDLHVSFAKERDTLSSELSQEKDTNKELQARISDQEEEMSTLRDSISILEQKESNHMDEIAHLKSKITKLEKKERDTSDELLKARACLSLARKTELELRERVKQLEPSVSTPRSKHRFKVNDVVEALWEDDLWYPATVQTVLKQDMYRVKFLEDSIVCDVAGKSIKPLL